MDLDCLFWNIKGHHIKAQVVLAVKSEWHIYPDLVREDKPELIFPIIH